MQTKPDLKIVEIDKKKLIEFLNFGAKHTKLENATWEESIEFVSLLTYMQQVLVPKLSHIIESLEAQPEKKEDDSAPVRVKAELMGPEKSKKYKEETKGEPKAKAEVKRRGRPKKEG